MVKPKPKFRSKAGRIRNPKRSPRWAKGDSCLSNPETRKFREQASALYFHHVVKNPLLTAKNLRGRELLGDDLEDDVLSADVQSLTVSDSPAGSGSFTSCKTFASDWSKCSNGAFEKFLGRFKLDSALHKEMLSILAATTEVINSLGGSHRETEYFASFITAIDQCETTQYEAMMALLSIVSGRVPEGVVRKTFPLIYHKLSSILDHAMNSFDNSLMRVTCNVLKKVLSLQHSTVFESNLPARGLIYGVLRCALHENPKVRRKARQTIGFILIREKEKSEGESVAKIVLGWILDQLATYPTTGIKSASDAIGLLQFVWPNVERVSSSGTKKLYESVLRVMSSGEMALIKIGFSFFSVVFQTHVIRETDDTKLKPDGNNAFTSKLLGALSDFRPDWRHHEAFLLWLQCITNGLIRLNEDQPKLGGAYISRLIDNISATWTSTWGPVPSKFLIDHFQHLIREHMTTEDVDLCFGILSKNLISVPPNENCLAVLGGFIDSLKPEQFTISGREVLLQILQLRNSSTSASKVNEILGKFVKCFGIDNLWISVEAEIRETVILPLVKENLNGGQLAYWKQHIFPLLHQPNLVTDVWNSLIGFCRNPIDPNNFPAEFVGKTIVKRPEYRLVALAALRQFSLWPQSRKTLQKYGNNYLPLLFNLYVNERQVGLGAKKDSAEDKRNTEVNRGHSDAIASTIREYLPHLEEEFIHDLIRRAVQKYREGSGEEKGPILDLLAHLSAFEMDPVSSREIFDISSSLILDKVEMKRGYRILLSLLKTQYNQSENKLDILHLLRESKGTTKSNVEALRLNSIVSLVLKNEEWMVEFLPEAILCLLSVNTRARKAATFFVSQLSENLKEEKISLTEVEGIVELGLASPTSFIVSSTFHFLVLLYRLCPPAQPQESFINMAINHLLEEEKDSAICRESLTFLSLNLSLYKSEIGPFAASLGRVLSIGTIFPRKEMNKILSRMIRVFGVAGLKAVLLNADEPKMNRRIRNIERKLRKLNMRKSTSKDEEREEPESEESDGEEEGRGKKGENLVIKEGLVDFLDPKNMTSSLICKRKEGTEGTLRFSSDGKLIVEDLDGYGEEKRQGTKRDLEETESSEDESHLDVKSRRKKLRSGCSVSSKQSRGSTKTNFSRKSKVSSSSFVRKQSEPRLKLRAKRRKGKSSGSIHSVKSSRTKKSLKQKK